jgi:hypothetical protein
MEHVQASGGVERYDDLHIDLIDSKWKDRANWVSGGISALILASSMSAFIGRGLVVVLGMSLCTHNATSPIPGTADSLLAQLDESTPPSLYLFRSGYEPWHDSHCSCRFLEMNFGQADQDIKGIYLEFKHEDGELRRSFFMIDGSKLHTVT